ncbi:MAG: 3-oxoacyl-ACP synthase [Burkholderiales bacterium]|nr:3-oxoacyl-ACP synthase [Burkholderiales bacterium]
MKVYLKGIGAIGPGFENLDALAGSLQSGSMPDFESFPRPQGNMLPGAERRRASPTVKLAVEVASQALLSSGLNAQDLALVFASSNGDTDTIHQICETLATSERFVSPTRFHNSVHNAAAGYWSIASGSMQPSSSLCAWNGSFSAALLEASGQCLAEGIPVLLAAFDTPFPFPLQEFTPAGKPFGVAMVLDRNPENSIATLSIELCGEDPDSLSGWEAMRSDSSAARAVPLLAALAKGGEVVLEYLEDLSLKVGVTPCAFATAAAAGAAGTRSPGGCA